MLDAGVKIVGHTEAVTALDQTLSAARGLQAVAPAIEEKTGVVADIISKRAEGNA
jgi:hypothetical protein